MAALPLEQRIDRLPNWAQAYIGRLNRQILQLKERAGNLVPEPTRVSSQDVLDGEVITSYLPLPNESFMIQLEDDHNITVHVRDYSIELSTNKFFAIFPREADVLVLETVDEHDI